MKFEKQGRVGLTSQNTMTKHKIFKPEFLKKDPSLSGLELVDLIAYHFARGLVGKKSKKPQNGIPLELIQTKIVKYFALPAHPNYYLQKEKAGK